MRIEPPRNGKLRYDILTMGPAGLVRERRNFPEALRTEAARTRWLTAREAHLTRNGQTVEEVPAPTLKDFGPRWIKEYARANGNKPSTIDTKETILRLHLYPVLGSCRLDGIRAWDIQRLKLHLQGKAPKTQACVLSVLATLLSTAEEWGEIVKAPRIELPKWQDPTMEFYDFQEWEALIDGARRAGPVVFAAILLGGDAGLRRGELVALEQADTGGGAIAVRRNEWEGQIGAPKGGKSRRIPATRRLQEAIAAVRHLRGKRLLWQANGAPVKVTTLQSWLEVACKRAGLPESRNLHKLRHTFCSHLAMRGVPVIAIKEWAGHADLKTTMRYMHLSPQATDHMIEVLERVPARGAGPEQRKGKARK